LVADYNEGLQIISAKTLAGEQYLETGKQPIIPKGNKGNVIKTENMIKYISNGQIRNCYLDDNYIYLACGSEGLEILSIKDPTICVGKIKDIG